MVTTQKLLLKQGINVYATSEFGLSNEEENNTEEEEITQTEIYNQQRKMDIQFREDLKRHQHRPIGGDTPEGEEEDDDGQGREEQMVNFLNQYRGNG